MPLQTFSHTHRFIPNRLLAAYLASAGLLLLSLVFSSIVAASPAAPADLEVRITAEQSDFLASDAVAVTVTINNRSDRDIRLPKWLAPKSEMDAPLFVITRDGSPAPYLGKLVKRAAPTAADQLTIPAAGTVTFQIDLGRYYDLSASANYAVSFDTRWLQDFAEPASVGSKGKVAPTSNTLRVFVRGRPNWMRSSSGSKAVNGSTTFVGCDAPKTAALTTARDNALSFATGAASYFAANRNGVRYSTWFGTYDSGRYTTVGNHYVSIRDAFSNADPLVLDCTCTDSYFAYVYANEPYVIYLCNAFWPAPATGTDSKMGTLIHEMSHFTIVAGTDDFAYGQSGAMNLAINNPAQAIMNADSHEYFVENTPTQEPVIPDAPIILNAQPGDTTANITFQPPVYLGSTDISNYEYSIDDGGSWTARAPAATASPLNINGLTNGVVYPIRLRAVNDSGSGTQSDAVNVTPLVATTIPGAPTAVTAIAGAASALVSFAAPADDGGSVITSYQATSNPGALTASCATSPCNVSGLTAGVPYTFTVRAMNSNGFGPASAPSASVIPTAAPDLGISIVRTSPGTSLLYDGLVGPNPAAIYEIAVSNNRPDTVNAIAVQASAGAALSGPAWQCLIPANACTPETGSNPIALNLALDSGQTATIEVSVDVDIAEHFAELMANAKLPPGTTPIGSDETSLTFIEAANMSGLFKGGFE